MDRTVETLRREVLAYRTDEARERVAHYREDPDADAHAAVVGRHRWLGSREARDALGELHERGRMTAAEVGATAAHAAGYLRDGALASVRDTQRAFVGRGVDVGGHAVPFGVAVSELFASAAPERTRLLADGIAGAAARARGPILEAVARADEAVRPWAALAALDPDRPRETVTEERVDAFLRGTSDLRDEALDWLFGRAKVDPSWTTLPRALRAKELDDAFPRSTRLPRASAMLERFGALREVAARVRVEPSHRGVDPRVRMAVVGVPGAVHIAPSRLELGLLGELALLEGLGRAWAVAWTHPALPPALAWPREGTVGRATGAMLVRLATTPESLARQRRWPGEVVDRVRRLAATVALLGARVAAVASSPARVASAEAAVEALREATGLVAPAPVAELVLRSPRGGPARFEGATVGLSLHATLRDRFDEDYDRNPRTAEALRAGLERGASLGASAWLGELGGTDRAVAELAAWFLGR